MSSLRAPSSYEKPSIGFVNQHAFDLPAVPPVGRALAVMGVSTAPGWPGGRTCQPGRPCCAFGPKLPGGAGSVVLRLDLDVKALF